MKKYIFGILAVAMAVGFSAFTTKKASKPFSAATYYFVSAKKSVNATDATNQIVTSGIDRIQNTAKWTTSNPGYTSFQNDQYLAKIEFDEVDMGGGQLTLQEAIDGLKDYYVGHSNTLPTTNGSVIPVTKGVNTFNVTMYLKQSNSSSGN